MASGSLSQSEVDLLLDAPGAAVGAAGAQRRPDVQVYDFRRPHRVSKERLRTLEVMYGRLAKSLEGWLMGRVRGQVEVSLQSVEQLSFGEFALSLASPSCSYLFDLRDSGGQQGVIDFGREFAFFLVDRLFGGSGTPTVPDRALTPIERMAVRVVADRVAALVGEVWRDQVDLQLALSGWESVPEILMASNREVPVLVASVELSAAGQRSPLMICLPFTVLEKFFVGAAPSRVSTVIGSEQEREVNRGLAETSLRATRVEIGVRLPQFRISLGDLSRLREGGVLSTGIPCSTDVELLINGQARFRGAPGRVRRNLAVRILEPVARLPESFTTTNPPEARS